MASSRCISPCFHAVERNARPFGDDVHDVVFGDDDFLLLAAGRAIRSGRLSSFSLACFSLSRRAAAPSKSWALIARFLVALDVLDLRLDVLHFRRAGHGADARARAGFVHDVDGLVGQKAAGEVAVGKLDGGLDGLVGDLGLVVRLVFGAQALEDQDGFLDGRGLDHDRLEAAFERGVLLDVLAVFVERGRADALQFAAARARA